MKKRLSILIILLIILFLLIYPEDGVYAAANGLLLWYENILPALLPFTIFSNILICSGYLDDMIRWADPILNRLFFGHPHAAYPVVTGFLFGFPLGSKAAADLVREKKLSVAEGNILCAMCNNISPMFVSSYLLNQSLGIHGSFQIFISYGILYLPSLITGLLLLKRLPKASGLYRNKNSRKLYSDEKKAVSRSQLNFQIIDTGIMNGFETLLKLGGYIMLFSLLVQICMRLAKDYRLPLMCLTGITEITNGIHIIAKSPYPMSIRYPWLMAVTAFGGFSGCAQTASMIRDTGISIGFYVCFRLVQSALAGILAMLLPLLYLRVY